ncbi:DUF1565 domain-containing protein [Candidatus Woesearchaeota archaeon]|nr:DUF1565 domain-containing protein [Candidatus Woesearchaeota archaeon]
MKCAYKISSYSRINILALIFLIFIISQMQAAFGQAAPSSTTTGNVYYVATTGLDSNAGTITAPFRTIQKAANTVQAGDTVYVLPGTYTLTGPGAHPTYSNYASIYTSKSGTAAQPVQFISTLKWGAKIVSTGNRIAWLNDGAYVTIQGFDITGTMGVGILSNGNYSRIIGNHVHDYTSSYCDSSGSGTGIGSGRGNYVDIIGNLVDHLSVASTCPAGQIHGIYAAYTGMRIINNVVNNVKNYCIHVYHAPVDNKIFSNTAFNCGSGIIVAGTAEGLAKNNSIKNNIIYQTVYYGIHEYATTRDGTEAIKNNLIYKTGILPAISTDDPTTAVSGNIISLTATQEAALFVNYQAGGSGDYRLQSTSPAINAGATLGVPYNVDYDGVSRPQEILTIFLPQVLIPIPELQLLRGKLLLLRFLSLKLGTLLF